MNYDEQRRKIREQNYRDRLIAISRKIWNLQNDVADAFESRNPADYRLGVDTYLEVNKLLVKAAKLCEEAK